MLRVLVCAGMICTLALATGCTQTTATPTPTTAQNDHREQLNQCRRERDDLARRLRSEQSRTASLQQRAQHTQVSNTADQSELATLRSRVRELESEKQQLYSQLKQRAERPVQRPTIAASTLPANVDQALANWANRYTGRVAYDRGRGGVSFANDRLFELGSDQVRADAKPALNDLAAILGTLPGSFEFVIAGHTDSVPIRKPETKKLHPTNWHLSVHRAIAVKDVFSKAGVSAKRFGVMGYGQYRPVGNDGAKNRRVEVFIVRKGAVQGFAPVR